MFTAVFGEKTYDNTTLPDVQEVTYGKQYIGGSLFKSQNGTIWTTAQYEDLTKLYKAQFKPSGTLTWYNSSVLPKGDNSTVLEDNPIQGLPRKLKLDISGSGTLNASVVPGIKVKESAAGDTVSGFVENIGGPALLLNLLLVDRLL